MYNKLATYILAEEYHGEIDIDNTVKHFINHSEIWRGIIDHKYTIYNCINL